MADAYGALDIPAPAPGTTDVAGDPAITYLSAFLEAVLKNDLDTAWAAIAPGTSIVQQTYTHSPETEFTDAHLPALYVYRGAKHFERIADDWETDQSQIDLVWIPDLAPQELQSRRWPFLNAVASSIDRAIFDCRNPAWAVVGDADTKAATHGSSLLEYCGFAAVTVDRNATRITPVAIEMQDHAPLRFQGLAMQIHAIERLTRDPSVCVTATNPAAMHTDVQNSTGTTTDQVEG